ncbi:helix-turn-helix domain-containing protein [Streptomyces albireticuli]
MSVGQLAALTHTSARHLYNLVERSELPVPFVKFGRAIRIPSVAVLELITGRPYVPDPDPESLTPPPAPARRTRRRRHTPRGSA